MRLSSVFDRMRKSIYPRSRAFSRTGQLRASNVILGMLATIMAVLVLAQAITFVVSL
jgi:hypothetical protein